MMTLDYRADRRSNPRRLFRRSRKRPRPTRSGSPFLIEELELRSCPSLAPGLASAAIDLPVDPNVSRVSQLQEIGATDLYQVSVDADGLFVAQVHAQGFDTRLSLLDGQGQLLIQSEASSPGNPDDRGAIHLTAGDYFLMVQDLTGGGSYTLGTSFVNSTAPSQPLSDGLGSYSIAVAEFNGDKIPDIVTTGYYLNQVLIDMGNGDGTFQPPVAIPVGTAPVFVATADLTGNGIQDIITANQGSNDLSIFIGVGRGANWELEPGPRLRVGDEPVSTTVAEVDDDGIPDIICVDQGSNNMVELRQVGGGFFDDSDPLTLPTGQSPIQAFVGKFDNGPGLGLAVLDSGSSDLTYYLNFLSGKSTPKFIPTGGLDPIAGVMGDYNDDGYNDLVIANNGDNLITLFEGGPNGLVLTNSDLLDQSVHPTDLVFSGTDSGQLHLDISAEGQDQVIPVTFILTLGTSGPVAGGGNPSTPGTLSQAAAPRGSLLSTNGLFSSELLSTELSSQEQGSVQGVTPSSGPTVGSGQVVLGMATILTTLDQVINLSAGPLPGVINNLVQVGQVQISDLMPLENSAMETVAVLLVVSSGSVEASNGHDIASPAESEAGVSPAVELALSRERDPSATESNLERFLSDLEGALDGVPRDVLGESEQQTGAWPQWVLRPREPGMVAVTVAGVIGPDRSAAILNPGPTPSTVVERNPGEDVAVSDLHGLDWESPQPPPTTEAASGRLGWMGPFCGMLVISSVLLGWKAARKRWRAARSQPPVRQMPTIAGPHFTTRLRASKSLGSRASRIQDLPPWLAGPTSEG